jgi:DNA-binding CsgD family transcriptional regulator
MALPTSQDYLRRLQSTLHALLSPLAAGSAEAWCRQIGPHLEALFGGDATIVLMPVAGSVRCFSEGRPEVCSWFEQNVALKSGAFVSEDAAFSAGMATHRHYRMAAWTFPLVDRMTGHRLSRSPFYNDVMIPITGVRASVGLFAHGPAGESALSIGAERADWDPFGEDGLTLLGLILPAFSAGLEILAAFDAKRSALVATLDGLTEGVLIWDGSGGRELYRNRALGEMASADPQGERLVAAAIRLAGGLIARGIVAMQAAQPPRVLTELVTAAASYRLRASLLPAGGFSRDGTVMVAVERTTPALPTPAQLQAVFGLSDREASIALWLSTGATDVAIAEAVGLSPHTVRHHVERIFLKVGVHSRKAIARDLGRAAGWPGSVE